MADTASICGRLGFSKTPVFPRMILVALLAASWSPAAFGEDIHVHAGHGRPDLVQSLLKEDPSRVSRKDDTGNTPLHYAARNGRIDVAELLLTSHAEIDAKNDQGRTPLHLAAEMDEVEMAKILLKYKADVGAYDSGGARPLYLAAAAGRNEMVEFLASSDTYPGYVNVINYTDNKGRTPLLEAAERGHAEVVRILLEKGADIDPKDFSHVTPLVAAVRNNQEETARLLLEKGADIHGDGMPPLSEAVQCGHTEMIGLLLEKGADINRKNRSGETALFTAVRNNQKEIARLLLEKGADIHGDGMSPLSEAVQCGHTEMIGLLLEKGADINRKYRSGETPLVTAIRYNRTEIAKLLVDKGADIHVRDSSGKTPLFEAATAGHLEFAALFLEKGADVNAQNSNGETPLFDAGGSDSTEIARLFLEKGADVNHAANLNGTTYTAVAAACRRGDQALVGYLYRKGGRFELSGPDDTAIDRMELFAMVHHVGADALLAQENLPEARVAYTKAGEGYAKVTSKYKGAASKVLWKEIGSIAVLALGATAELMLPALQSRYNARTGQRYNPPQNMALPQNRSSVPNVPPTVENRESLKNSAKQYEDLTDRMGAFARCIEKNANAAGVQACVQSASSQGSGDAKKDRKGSPPPEDAGSDGGT